MGKDKEAQRIFYKARMNTAHKLAVLIAINKLTNVSFTELLRNELITSAIKAESKETE